MKTFVPKGKDIERKWLLIDAKGQTLGKVAVLASNLLRGKNKATFTPHLDMGDNVIIINAKEVRVTGNKEEDKKYYSHSWYPGGLKTKSLKEMRQETPEKIIENAIIGMLPKNKLARDYRKKLKIYPGAEHNHEAQKPQEIKLEKGAK